MKTGKMALPKLDLVFNEDRHEYTYHGYILPSVTQIMEPMSVMLYRDTRPDVLQVAATRGTLLHEQVSSYVLYGIPEHSGDSGSDAELEPYFNAFLSFEQAMKPEWVGSEYRLFHRALRYAGTLDLIGFVEPDDGTGVDVVDLKTTAKFYKPMLETQVSAYAEALKSQGVKIRKRYGLQLLKSGKWHMEELIDGFDTFIHCLAIHNKMALGMS